VVGVVVEELSDWVAQAQKGHYHAYSKIVQRFQDMAVGYSYALLGDMDLAEDAAQEAFINAFYNLSCLRNPAAFPGWLRRIVFTQANRLSRRKKLASVSLDKASEEVSQYDQNPVATSDPLEVIESREVRDEVFAAIATLSDTQREVVTLFYISSYSYKEISTFLDLPISTVKMRLYQARKQLRERMITMIEDSLEQQRPSKDNAFVDRVMNLNDRIVEMEKALHRLIGETTDLKTILAPDLWSIKADPIQTDQVTTSLAVYAYEAMPDGGRLTIETMNVTLNDPSLPPYVEQSGEYILLTISDTSQGISGELLSYIFESSSALETVYNFVEQHRGYIWVSSEKGRGTIFKIYLPRSDF
jgi:RNA polymerase sigma factor (sigma-70 family)